MAGDGHIATFLKGGQEGVPDPEAEAHFARDVRALAAAAADQIDANGGVLGMPEPAQLHDGRAPTSATANSSPSCFREAWHGQHRE